MFLMVVVTGFVLFPVIDNYIVLLAVLFIQYIVLLVILLHLYDKYIKPVKLASETVEKLVEGNYQARIYQALDGTIGQLSKQINNLARNLSELSFQEQMQAEQLTTVIDNIESGLVMVDEKGYIHLVNRKFLDMFGKDSKDYVGHLYYEAIGNEIVHKTVQQAFLYEKNIKDSIEHTQGMERSYFEIVGAPIFNERQMLKGAVIVFYDITEFKKLELMRKDFVANVSHELKTPITSITGFAETLVEDKVEEDTQKHFLEIIYKESKRLQTLVEDLLILSKLEQDEMKLDITHINIKQLVEDVVPIIEQQAQQKAITFNVDIESELSLMADGQKVKQILINLLSNAVNYTPAGGCVSLDITEEAERIRIRVQDTGIGMPKEAIHRIFERFYRVDQARSRATGGTGLGLAITKHAVEVHHGEILVESELNKGSTFTVYLPKEQEIAS